MKTALKRIMRMEDQMEDDRVWELSRSERRAVSQTTPPPPSFTLPRASS